jgi:hypothetical protein
MSNFITIAEVQKIAFEQAIGRTVIPELYITVAQQAHLRPAMGDDFFARLDAANSGLQANEVVLKGHLKNALAYYVKFECLPHIGIKVTNQGINFSDGYNSENAGVSGMKTARSAALETAQKLMQIAERYIVTNAADLTYYTSGDAIGATIINSNGGVIIPK